jgi:hypothetical protein
MRRVPILLVSSSLLTAATARAQDRYQPLVEGILAAWSSADVVCLGENHGRKYDSDLRIALVRHPRFPRVVRIIVVESANPADQDLLDRFILEGAPMTRDELAPVWRDASGAEVWESPIYEEFLRAVRDVNLRLPRDERVRVIGGDTPIDWRTITSADQLVPLLNAGLMNRGGNIRKIIAEQVLDKKLKGLAIYGAGHCVKVGMGFPGELADKYPGRIWSVSGFFEDAGARKGKQVFGLGDNPAYVVTTGTKWEPMPATGILWPYGKETIGDMVDAIVFYGDVADVVVQADTAELRTKYGAELERRRRLLEDAMKRRRGQ